MMIMEVTEAASILAVFDTSRNTTVSITGDGAGTFEGLVWSKTGFKFPDSTVQTTAAGPSPIAFGGIDTDASVLSEWPAGISATWNAGLSRYEVTIPGVSYLLWDYATVVTPIRGTALTVTTDSISGKLTVYLYDSSGNKVQGGFHFVIYKP